MKVALLRITVQKLQLGERHPQSCPLVQKLSLLDGSGHSLALLLKMQNSLLKVAIDHNHLSEVNIILATKPQNSGIIP